MKDEYYDDNSANDNYNEEEVVEEDEKEKGMTMTRMTSSEMVFISS